MRQFSVCIPEQYEAKDGTAGTAFHRVGVAFENTTKSGKQAISVKLGVTCIARNLVLFEDEPKDERNDPAQFNDEIPF